MYEFPSFFNRTEIENIISADVITFDFFDTLVMRRFGTQDHFYIHGPIKKYLRIWVELIYRVFQKILHFPDFKLSWLSSVFDVESEFRTDCTNQIPIEKMIKLANSLAKDKYVAIVSNSFYSSEQIKTMGDMAGLVGVSYFASSDYGLQKSRNLKSKIPLPKGDHFHCGDDPKEDAKFGADYFKLFNKFVNLDEFKSYIHGYKPEIVNFSLSIGQPDYWFKFGYSIVAPAIVETAVKLKTIFENSRSTNLICLGRDGYLVNWYLNQKLDVPSTYLPYSRKLAASKEVTKLIVDKLNLSTDQRVLIFDIGWTGRTANFLKNHLTNGSEVVLAARWPWSKTKVDYEIFTTANRTSWIKFRKSPEVWELSFTAPYKSATNYETVISPINLEPNSSQSLTVEGALTFLNTLQTSEYGSIKALQNLIQNPRNETVLKFSEIMVDFQNVEVPLVSQNDVGIVFWPKAMRKFAKMNGLSGVFSWKLTLMEWFRRLRSAIRWSEKESN